MSHRISPRCRFVLVGDDGHENFTELATDPRVRTVVGFCRKFSIPTGEYEYLEVQERDGDDYEIVDSWYKIMTPDRRDGLS